MPVYLLSIESATTVCSVCLSADAKVIAKKEINNGFSHAENLHVFISGLLEETGMSLQEIQAIAVSKGPGSYTGLRIGVSTAKGLCYALSKPLISIDTLESMAHQAIEKIGKDQYYCPMLDARRMEVYCAVYNQHLEPVLPVQARVLDAESINIFKLDKPICFFGDGMPKCMSLLEHNPWATFEADINPSSVNMVQIALKKYHEKKFEEVAYFEPFYLKEFYVKPKP